MRKVVSMISANVRPAAACSENSTPSCARARAIALIGSLPGRQQQRRRELEAEQEKAEAQARYARRMRRWAAFSGALAAVSIAFLVMAIVFAVKAHVATGAANFREDEAHLFFGRENQVDAMVDKLR
jgi:hypothetical protein